LLDLAGGSNVVYMGEADCVQPTAVLPVASVSTANPAVITSAAHGLASDNLVKISGATGDWAALNGQRVITVLSANTFSVAVDSSAFAGSFDGQISTTAPRTSASCWKITKSYYDGSNPPNLIRTSLAGGGASNQIYDNRATVAYN
jgi:hypothetical protein